MTSQFDKTQKKQLFFNNFKNPSLIGWFKDKINTLANKPKQSSHVNIRDNQPLTWQVRFDTLRTSKPMNFSLEINNDLILGVDDSQSDMFNLSRHGKDVSGVSHRHLKLSPTEHSLLITDLNSSYGTRRNGKLIDPETPYSVHDGDILELGNLVLVITIVKSPGQVNHVYEKTRNLAGVLNHLSAMIVSGLKFEDVLDRILEFSKDLMDANSAVLLLWDKNLSKLSLKAELGAVEKETQYRWQEDDQVSEVFRKGQSRRLTMADESNREGRHPLIARVIVPLTFGEDSMGVLIAIRSNNSAEFTAGDEYMLGMIARHISIAIRDSQRIDLATKPIQKKLDELSLFYEISQSLLNINNLTDLYSLLREFMRNRWKVENVGLWLVDEYTNNLVPFPKPSFHKTYAFGEELIGSVASQAEPVLASDIRLYSTSKNSLEPTLQLLAQSAVCVPMIDNGDVLGVLALFSTKANEFNEEDVRLVQTFAQAAATTVRNVLLFEQVDKQRATVFGAVNMLQHPLMIIDNEGKLVVSNNAANTMINELQTTLPIGKDGGRRITSRTLAAFLSELSESKSKTKEIVVGDKMYVATLEFASMVGTIILLQDMTDPVTGQFNHRYFISLAEHAFVQAKRYLKPLAVLVIGFEDFREVIDNQGYAVGNQILRKFAVQLRGFLRTPDILGRYQDEEFIIILPEIALENAKITADRLLRLLVENPIKDSAGKKISKPTLGIAMLDFDTDNSINDVMAKAYKAFLLTKLNKKNKIVVYES